MQSPKRIICLSNVHDQQYHELRGEEISRCLSSPKRRDLFRCLELASGLEVIVLSSPPKAAIRRRGKWLPSMETRFSSHRQFFCANWDAPKLRILASWPSYALHVLRHTQSGDIVLIDNYELIYVLAAWVLRLFRKVTFILDYEDGKHLIDRSIWRFLNGVAEAACRPLLNGALLAHPALGDRLPPTMTTELVPGFIQGTIPVKQPGPGEGVRFLYSGTLDSPRGVDLLLEAVELLPAQGWHLDITGHGPLSEQVSALVKEKRWVGRVEYHQSLPPASYDTLKAGCHAGLNCQRASDPISGVTFPSKMFTYLSAGLLVISSRASEVDKICGKACLYYDAETPQSLAAAMNEIITDFAGVCARLDRKDVAGRYSEEATMTRLRQFLQSVGCLP